MLLLPLPQRAPDTCLSLSLSVFRARPPWQNALCRVLHSHRVLLTETGDETRPSAGNGHRRRYWSPGEIELLTKLRKEGKRRADIIAHFPRRTPAATDIKSNHLGLRSSSPWTDEEIDTLRAMQSENKTIYEINSAIPSKTLTQIRRWVHTPHRPRRFTSEERQHIEELRANGMNMEQIHQIACNRMSFHTFSYILRRSLNLDKQDIPRVYNSKPFTDDHDDTIRSLLRDDYAVGDIAHSLRRHYSSVKERIDRLGLKSNPSKQSAVAVPWTEDESRRMQIAIHNKTKLHDMYALFPLRSTVSINSARQRMIKKEGGTNRQCIKWTSAEEAELLHLHTQGLSLPEMVSKLNRSLRAVEAKLYKLGRYGLRRGK